MIAKITLRGRTPEDRKERDLDLFPESAEPGVGQDWIGLSIRQPAREESFASVWVLKQDLVRALEAMSPPPTQELSAQTEWLIEQVKQRRLSYGKAAELAGIPKARFIQLLGSRHVSSIDFDEGDLDEEIRAAEVVAAR